MRADIDPAGIDDVILGCVSQVGEQAVRRLHGTLKQALVGLQLRPKGPVHIQRLVGILAGVLCRPGDVDQRCLCAQ